MINFFAAGRNRELLKDAKPDDLIVIGYYTPNKSDVPTQPQIRAMKIKDFLSGAFDDLDAQVLAIGGEGDRLVLSGGTVDGEPIPNSEVLIRDIFNGMTQDIKDLLASGDVCNITLTPVDPVITLGEEAIFQGDPFGVNELRIIPNELNLTRWFSGGIYNSAVEGSYDFTGRTSPADTEWNSIYTDPRIGYQGHSNLENLNERVFGTWSQAVNDQAGLNILTTPLVMRHIPTGRVWLFTFTEWGSGSRSGLMSFNYTEVFIEADYCEITYSDGTKQNTAAGAVKAGDNISVDKAVDLNGFVSYTVNGIPAPIFTSRTVWVDPTYGNDSTAAPERFDLPYRTLTPAMTEAQSRGGVVILRPGIHSTLTLLNGVDIYMMAGASVRQIRDAGQDVQCRITGQGVVNRGFSNDAIVLTGANTDVYMELDEVIAAGVYFVIQNCKWTAKIRKVQGGRFNGALYRPRGNCKIDLTITDTIQSGGRYGNTVDPWIFSGYALGSDCGPEQEIRVKANHVLLNNGTRCGNLFEEGAGTPCNIQFDIKRFTNLYTGTQGGFGSNVTGCILKRGSGYISCKIGEVTTIQNMFMVRSVSGSGLIEFEGDVTCVSRAPIVVDNLGGGHTVKVKNSVLRRLSGGDDNNRVAVNTVAGNLYLENCKLVKESAGGQTNDVVYINNASQKTFIKDTEIILLGTTGFACDSGSVANGNVYFRDVVSNVDNGANITDIAVVPGFTGNDTALEI